MYFFQQYIQRFIHIMEQELIDTDQIGLNSNTFFDHADICGKRYYITFNNNYYYLHIILIFK